MTTPSVSKPFLHLSALAIHQRTYTGEKPHHALNVERVLVICLNSIHTGGSILEKSHTSVVHVGRVLGAT